MRERLPLALLLLAFATPAQTPQPTARLEGQVIDALHEPAPNALVVAEHDGIVVAKTRTDGQGSFLFPRVPAQYVVVRATTDAPDIGAVLVDLWGEGRGFARVQTMPARKLSGTVRDDAGNAVADAWVLASPKMQFQDVNLSYTQCVGRSDADGHYELLHVPMGSVHVRAWTPLHDAEAFAGMIFGREDTALDCIVNNDESEWYTFQLIGATEEQLAHAELRVAAVHDRHQVPLPPPLSRPSPTEPGLWDVCGWTTADQIHAWLTLPHGASSPGQHVVRPGVGTIKLRFDLSDANGAIVGRLRDTDGNPVSGVQLLAQPIGNGGVNCSRRSSTSADDGTFAIQAPVDINENFAVRSMSPQHALVGNDSNNPVWFVEQHTAEHQWNLEVRPAQTVRLRAVDLQENPLSGVTAALLQRGDKDAILGSGISSLDGRIEISCLTVDLPSTLFISAAGPGGVGELETLAHANDDLNFGDLELEPAGSILGAVYDTLGAPVAGARVRVQMRARRYTPTFWLSTNRDGKFRVGGLSEGLFSVFAAGSSDSIAVEAGFEVQVDLVAKK